MKVLFVNGMFQPAADSDRPYPVPLLTTEWPHSWSKGIFLWWVMTFHMDFSSCVAHMLSNEDPAMQTQCSSLQAMCSPIPCSQKKFKVSHCRSSVLLQPQHLTAFTGSLQNPTFSLNLSLRKMSGDKLT